MENVSTNFEYSNVSRIELCEGYKRQQTSSGAGRPCRSS